jgi:DNA-binding MltR family transcriptional regulator
MADANHWLKVLNEEFNHTSDRSCVIVATSILERLLGDLLRAHLVPNNSSTDTLFDGPNAPVSTLSARIDFAYRLGLISHQLARDLHLIRRIRNDFAHSIEGCSFQNAGVTNQVSELIRSQDLKSRAPFMFTTPYDSVRGHFILSVSLIVTFLDELVRNEVKQLSPASLDWLYRIEWKDSSS